MSSKKKAKRAVPSLEWTSYAMFSGIVRGQDKTLMVVVTSQSGRWSVSALETPTALVGSVQGVFDDHAHKVIGTYDDIPSAFRAAESFALSWGKKHKVARFDVCTCEAIDDVTKIRNGATERRAS